MSRQHHMHANDRIDEKLKWWASMLEQDSPAVGYSPISQTYRMMVEGPQGMLSHGQIGDGGMLHCYIRHHGLMHLQQQVALVSRIVARMPREWRSIIEVAYQTKPGDILSRDAAANRLGIPERTYRDRLTRLRDYLDGALDQAKAA